MSPFTVSLTHLSRRQLRFPASEKSCLKSIVSILEINGLPRGASQLCCLFRRKGPEWGWDAEGGRACTGCWPREAHLCLLLALWVSLGTRMSNDTGAEGVEYKLEGWLTRIAARDPCAFWILPEVLPSRRGAWARPRPLIGPSWLAVTRDAAVPCSIPREREWVLPVVLSHMCKFTTWDGLPSRSWF